MRPRFLSLAATSFLLAACNAQGPVSQDQASSSSVPTYEFSYDIPTSPVRIAARNMVTDVTVEQSDVGFPYTVQNLKDMADECGTSHEAGHFEKLVRMYRGSQSFRYEFAASKSMPEQNTYILTILPNLAHYPDLAAAKKDFDQCWAAGDMYPFMTNDKWIVFENSCGTGAGFRGICDEVKENAEVTFKD